MIENGSTPFGEALRRYRLAAGLSQERLAERTGLSVRGLSDLERGARRTPRLETIRRLADGLGLDHAGHDALLRAARGANLAMRSASPSEPSHLPVAPTSLIGRDAELRALVDTIRDPTTRLVTLTGPGGVGKSRLALEVATQAADTFPHGAHLIELAPLRDSTLVVPAIAHVLGVRAEGSSPLLSALERFLRDRRVLLLLDNVEHLLAAAPDIAALLAASRDLTLLATSRVPLAIRGEQQHAVNPLPIPAHPDAGTVAASPCGQLFLARTRQVQPDFALDAASARAVTAICRRLDGLPLALELAAAHAKTLPPAALLARLERRLPLLTRGPRDLPERHRTLRDTITWSYDLLEPAERSLFRRLAVFARGWTLGAAIAIAGDDPDALETLSAVINASLATPIDSTDDEPRFTMLETIREFAVEKLRESGEEDATRAALADWVLELVERGGPELVGPDQQRWLARFDAERDNLRAALGWALERGDAMTAMRLANASWQYWLTSGNATEGRRWFDRVLALADGAAPSPELTETWFAAGTLASAQDDYATAEPLLDIALAALEASGESARMARTVHVLGIIALNRDDPARAALLLERALTTYGQPRDVTFAPWRALAHSQLAGALAALDEPERAAEHGTRGLALQREIGSELGEALARFYLGDVARHQNDAVAARRHYRDSIELFTRLGDRWYVLSALSCWLSVAAPDLPPRRAARLLGANAAIREHATTPIWPPYAGPLFAAEAHIRARLSDAGFARAFASGTALDLDAAIAETLALENETGARETDS